MRTQGPIIEEDVRRYMARKGFKAVVFISRDISVRIPGSVEAWFRTERDAKRFATLLNKTYGCKDGYKGVSV